jgi:hypothetical protein
MGLTLAACVTIGLLLGLWADASWGTSPVMLFVGLVVGCGAAGASVVAQIRRYL